MMSISGLISLLCGIYCVLLAYRIIPTSKIPETDELWHRKFGAMMKVAGPLIILFGIAQLFGWVR